MKAVILAAGKGVRMGPYAKNLPKGMLRLQGKTLIQWQIDALRTAGIEYIIIVKGYKKEAIRYRGIKYYHNPRFASTNMVESLMCARQEFDQDVLVSYADIIYTSSLVERMLAEQSEISVAVDAGWRDYWKMRYGTTEYDLETLTVKGSRIVELGREVDASEGIHFRYIGLVKFSRGVWPKVLHLYDGKRAIEEKWLPSNNSFPCGYMTDLLNELIGAGVEVSACISEKQWMEFDTPRDYETAREWVDRGRLEDYFGT